MDTQICPVWGKRGHLWIPFKGTFLFWRSYKGCASCNLVVRVKEKEK